VRTFGCDVCGGPVFTENTSCVTCSSALGYSSTVGRVLALSGAGGNHVVLPDATVERRCANRVIAACPWLAPEGSWGGLCLSCRLTRTRPADTDGAGLAAFALAEAAKRQLVIQLLDLRLPVEPRQEFPDRGLAFDLLSSAQAPVTTGHADGVITLDLAESDDAHREQMRVQMAEPYRTLLGHLRHEVGHYYWSRLVDGTPWLDRVRTLFGDDTEDYAEAVQRHYAVGPPDGWQESHVSAYATTHPWEDWAETFAHDLHIRDTVQTAAEYGVSVRGPREGRGPNLASRPTDGEAGLDLLIGTWLPLSYALNALNRSMGRDDLYPFVLTGPALAKLRVVHDIVDAAGAPVDA
jgi:hypothetical protein